MGLLKIFSKPKKRTSKPIRTIESITRQMLENKKHYQQMGFKEYTFHANSGCCEDCQKLNGKHFKLSKMECGVNAPPMHEGCRCSISAYSDRKEYDEWLDFLSKGGTTAEWEAKKKK